MSRRSGGDDAAGDARRARASDRDESVYERRRRALARRRADEDRQAYDPAPPSVDDWTVADDHDPAVRRIRPPAPIGDPLAAIVRRRGWEERLRGVTALSRWDDIVGVDLAGRCEPVRLAGGTLVVRAESQVWATQLRYLLPQLVTSARRILGDQAVREVRIVVGPLGRDDDR